MILLLLGWPCWILRNCKTSPKCPAGQLSQISFVISWEPKTIKKPCSFHDFRVHYIWVSGGNWTSTPELLPVGPPTDLDVSETANVTSDSEMALFTDVVKRGKRKTKARAIAPPAVAVVRKTGKSSAITGRGVGVGIKAIWAASECVRVEARS